MKHLSKTISCILISTLVLTSCKDDFLDIKPKGVLIPETISDYDKMMNGVASNLVGTYLVYADPDNGVSEQIVSSVSTYAYRAYGWEDFITTQDEQDNDWNTLYKSIFIANEVINNIDKASGQDESLRQKVKADAFAERAADYFILVNMYAKQYNPSMASEDWGVPLLLVNDLEQKRARSTVQEIYDQIKNDLEASLLNVRNGLPETKVRTSRAGVYGLLSRMYLFQGEFQKALKYSDSCLSIYNTLLNYNYPVKPGIPTPTQFDDNPEIIWYKDTYNFNYFVKFYFSQGLSNIFDRKNDLRWIYYAKDSTDAGEPILSAPYERPRRTINDRGMLVNTPVVLLVRAEAKIRTGNKKGAIDDLNLLRNNRFLPNTPLLEEDDFSEDDVLNEVINERRRELAFSGYHWFNLKRYQVQGPNVSSFDRGYKGGTITLSPGSPRYVFAIPPNVINLNSKLVQNER